MKEKTKKRMRKQLVSGICSLLLVVGLIMSLGSQTMASERIPVLDGSYLTTETESMGETVSVTRGVNLLTGYSKLRVVSDDTIYAGGTSIGAHTCERIGVSVRVERCALDSDEWETVTGWDHENQDADAASTSRRIKVDKGYFYRVVCYHYADGETSTSFTDGLYVGDASDLE